MSKKTLHVVSILDRSGSMSGSETEVIGAYNEFVKDQAKLAESKNITIKLTLVLFDNKYEEIYRKLPVTVVPELTSEVYSVRGMTALYDAIGKTVASFDDKKKVIFFIETDGYENSSHEYNAKTVKALVEKKTKDGWDFNFVGADLNSAETSSIGNSVGIAKTMSFDKSLSGYQSRNDSFSSATRAYVDNT